MIFNNDNIGGIYTYLDLLFNKGTVFSIKKYQLEKLSKYLKNLLDIFLIYN